MSCKKIHPVFEAIEDDCEDDANRELRYAVIGKIIENLYTLPIVRIMFLDEIVLGMTEEQGAGVFEYNMTKVLNNVSTPVQVGSKKELQ